MILQHIDRNIGPGAFAALDKDQLMITSIFYTSQGEGPYAGCPAIFVRLSGCNRGRKDQMGCLFCDTDFRIDKGKVMTFHQISQRMGEEIGATLKGGRGMPIVVITGGEPMMQNNLSAFIHYLRIADYKSIQVESNGDRLVPGFPELTTALVVSPKITGTRYRPLAKDVLDAASCFKFVISADPGSPYYDVPEWARSHQDRVYVSPMTVYKREVGTGMLASAWDSNLVDHHATRPNYRRAAELALENNYRLSMQQHLFFEIS